MELGIDKIRLQGPVITAIRSMPTPRCWRMTDDGHADAGIVRFKHYGVNQDDKNVFEGERTARVRRRSKAIGK